MTEPAPASAHPRDPDTGEAADGVATLPSLKQRLVSGGLWSFASRLIAAFTAFAANVLLARLLPPEELGAYFLAFSVVSVGSLLGLLGLEQLVVRLAAEGIETRDFGRARAVVRRVLLLGGLGAAGAGLVYLALGNLVATQMFKAPTLGPLTPLVAVWTVTVGLSLLLAEVFRGLHDIRRASIFYSLGNGVLLTAGLLAVLLFTEEVTLAAVLWLAIAANMVSVVLAAWQLRRVLARMPVGEPSVGDGRFRDLLRLASPLLVINITLVALGQGYVDLWIVGAFRPETEVAIFGAAARAVMLVVLPILVINSVVTPMIAGKHAQGQTAELERALRVAATAAAVPSVVVWIAFLAAGGPILGLLFGDLYREGALVLVLLSTGQIANVLVGPCGAALTMTGHQGLAMRITLAGAVVMVAGGLALVGPYGVTGVAAATAVGIIVTNLGYWLAVKRTTGMWTHASVRDLGLLASTAAKFVTTRR